ncbi:MAG: phosphohistidine phosphatase SixA [Deltaproteobacteria bacterium]|nr:phosphohistidine phosphatase SixA [Deltaproteobacteria bacterium]MBI3386709.1 phosphohistidine phosphatase SixA [Deltaproteobacteria bacterium]
MNRYLYLVRHGIAETESATRHDADRCLTEAGSQRMRRAAAGLKRLGVIPDAVLTSPLRRAEQTALILVETLAPHLQLETMVPLAPGHEPKDVLRGLGAYRHARAVMLVGHEPSLGQFASHLLTGSAAILSLEFKKGAVIAIAVATLPPHAAGTLEWFLTPKQLRAVARRGR